MYYQTNIPLDWSWVNLGDVLGRISNGCSAQQFQQKGIYPITRIETISSGEVDLDRVRYLKYLSKIDIDKYRLLPGDILFSHINSDLHLGKTALFKIKGSIVIHGINLLLLRVNDKIKADFLNYLFNYYRHKGIFLAIAQHAVNQSSINQKKLKELLIPLPPLLVQQQIVSKLESLFSELDKGVETLRKAKEQIKTYRQSVLKAAFEGKLTEGARSKKQEARSLEYNIAAEVKAVYKTNGLPEGWRWVKLGDEFKIVSGITPKGLENVSREGAIPFYKVSDMNNLGNQRNMNESNLYLTIEEVNELKIKIYPPNTIIFPKRGGAILTNKKRILSQKAAFDLNVMGVIPSERVNHLYLYYWFIKLDLTTIYDGSNVPQINNKNINPICFPLPSITVQKEIVSEIERRFSVADKLEQAIDEGLIKAEQLRQSILKQAFEGKLV